MNPEPVPGSLVQFNPGSLIDTSDPDAASSFELGIVFRKPSGVMCVFLSDGNVWKISQQKGWWRCLAGIAVVLEP